MESTTAKKPKTMAELLPGLSGILSRDSVQTLTAKKQTVPNIMVTRTAEKVLKPLTIAEMRADIQALKIQSPRRCAQSISTKKRIWNSSVKVDKRVSHTANGQLKNNPVRKVLQFQNKPKTTSSSRATMCPINPVTPKFPKPEFRAKKSLHMTAQNVRISGVFNIPETPVLNPKINKSRMTLANKENVLILPVKSNGITKKMLTPKVNCIQTRNNLIPDTPLPNESWKSSCDASFLQNEKEIHDIEEKVMAVAKEQTLEKIAEVSPPVSTPFKEYRNVKEYFDQSSELENSGVYNDNTIMCFEKTNNEENKREESVIVSLCDLLNKAKVSNPEQNCNEIEDLLQVEKQIESNIKMIENGIQMLKNIKKAQLNSLYYVKKLIAEKKNDIVVNEKKQDKTLTDEQIKLTPKSVKKENINTEKSPILGRSCSVIKSPSYKIPKRNLCLRKKVFHKSMPNMRSPHKETENKALDMYMQMKEQMNFLNTPVIKHTHTVCPDTPAVTSHNLQRQLDKLYGES